MLSQVTERARQQLVQLAAERLQDGDEQQVLAGGAGRPGLQASGGGGHVQTLLSVLQVQAGWVAGQQLKVQHCACIWHLP